MIRDKHKDAGYFKELIKNRITSHSKRLLKIESDQIKLDRIQSVKNDMAKGLMRKIISQYSLGLPIEEIGYDLNEVIDLIHESWVEYWLITDDNGNKLSQYTLSAYSQMSTLLSLSFLLGVSEDSFEKLILLCHL